MMMARVLMVVTMMISNGGVQPTQASKPSADTDDDDDGNHRLCTCHDDDNHAGMHFEFLRHPIPKVEVRSQIVHIYVFYITGHLPPQHFPELLSVLLLSFSIPLERADVLTRKRF